MAGESDKISRTETDLVMWVGTKHYPTVDDFIAEAQSRGCCKRVGKLPQIIELGRTRVFLAHDEGLIGEGFIFGYFVIARIEIIVEDSEALPEEYVTTDQPLTPITLAEARKEPERGCGWRDDLGALYLVGDPVDFVELKPVRVYKAFIGTCKRFRGALQITNGASIIQASMKDCTVVPSRSLLNVKPDKKPKWNKQANKKLLKVVQSALASGKSLRRACTEFALSTGRSRDNVIRHYNKLRKEKK